MSAKLNLNGTNTTARVCDWSPDSNSKLNRNLHELTPNPNPDPGPSPNIPPYMN